VLGVPNSSDGELARASALVYGRLAPRPVRPGGAGWAAVDDLESLVRAAAPRFGSADPGLVAAQVAREAISVLVTVGMEMLITRRRLLDLSAANVLLREGPEGVVVGLRDAVVVGLDDMDEAKLFDRFDRLVVGEPLPLGATPAGPADQVAAVAAVIAAVRRTVRSGSRHLWGTAALAVASTAVVTGADHDRDRILRSRPDLARTIELVTVPDDDAPLTFPLRRTCCLLYKLPPHDQCGTCSLRDRAYCLTLMTTWSRTERLRA